VQRREGSTRFGANRVLVGLQLFHCLAHAVRSSFPGPLSDAIQSRRG
jgi:hypothetical protein